MGASDKRQRLILTFPQGNVTYGVYARYVREITALPPLTAIPGGHEALRGIFAYKGDIVPALSFSALCGQDGTDAEQTCLIIMEDGGEPFGLSIARAEGLVTESMEMPFEQKLMNCGLVKISSVIRAENTVMIVDIKETFSGLVMKQGRIS